MRTAEFLHEPSALWSDLRQPRGGGWAYLLPCVGAIVVVLVWALLHVGSAEHAVADLTEYRPADSGWLTAVRLPLSAFAPADPLPVWVAAMEMFIGLALGCAVLGWRPAVAVGVIAHLLASLLVRVLLLAPDGVPAPLAVRYRYELDTGPSVVFMALVVCALLVRRRYALVGAFVAVAFGIGALTFDLAGSEHMIAVVVGAVAALVIVRRPDANRHRSGESR
jgi:hypothetical protein